MGDCKIIHNDANTIRNFFLFASSTLQMHKSLDTLHEKKPSASYKVILLSKNLGRNKIFIQILVKPIYLSYDDIALFNLIYKQYLTFDKSLAILQ